jgi:hypothetical protein
MMKKIFLYLQHVVETYATKAVTYHLPCCNSYAVHYCYYYYYDPVRGYTLSYHLRAFTSCYSEKGMAGGFQQINFTR